MRKPPFIAQAALTLTLLHAYLSPAAAQSEKMLHAQEKLTEKSQKLIEWLHNGPETGGKRNRTLLMRFDSLLSKMYEAKTDTYYVARPSTKWTLKTRIDFKATRFSVEGTDYLGKHYIYEMNSEEKKTLGININYKGLSTSLSITPAHLTGKNTDLEWFFNFYTNSFGGDISVNNLHSFTGTVSNEGKSEVMDFSGVKLQNVAINGYYVFNKRKFSYPAAFTQSYIQKRSQGSFLLGTSFSTGNIEVPGSLISIDNGHYINRIGMTHATVGAGYAYNYVPGRRWLLHLSALPSFVVWKNYTMHYSSGKDEKMPWRCFDASITGRFSAIYLTGFYFFGTTAVYQVSLVGDEAKFSLTKENIKARIFAGIRF
ncbi:MAG: DUF4421 domain-containing protein [Bacteroides sp.]|nr:DUF4421 domain-containing protein [Roseburia sp.]MCM1345565.1 DUF4421 domain-containing protein [Bacteroides sp.]MCM1420777.1 DUF4421 domain-containing protein [Bacteroides sp.]